jgi:RNA-directed DNA polymerase
MSAARTAPDWLLLPLPANALADEKLIASVTAHCAKLPAEFGKLGAALESVRALASYEPAANRANELIWERFEELLSAPVPAHRTAFVKYAADHLPERAFARVLRRFAKDPDTGVRAAVSRAIRKAKVEEVALPGKKDGEWDSSGWVLNKKQTKITRHKAGKRVQERTGVPSLATLADVRKLLGIRSSRQLGFFLLASDHKNGPYTTHTIPKRNGSERLICAPKKQLKWVQKQILKHIVSKVPPHPAAHGFVNGRSTVTNATPHAGAELLVKFDLKDFFPTVHYFRVMGFFASLGYALGNCMFGTDDESNQIAPVLARLCCYTPDPKKWGVAVLPQGAPTSPAISNLVCRRLDARLEGLAKANKGTYTRYADDLTFSFKTAEALNLGRFRWWVDQVCQQEGFTVNQPKFRVIRDSQRQVVTGLVVNDAPRVPRELRREIRAILHNCETKGVESQAARHPKFNGNVGAFVQYVRGMAAYLNMVQPEHGAELLRRANEVFGGGPPDPDAASDASEGEAKGGAE